MDKRRQVQAGLDPRCQELLDSPLRIVNSRVIYMLCEDTCLITRLRAGSGTPPSVLGKFQRKARGCSGKRRSEPRRERPVDVSITSKPVVMWT